MKYFKFIPYLFVLTHLNTSTASSFDDFFKAIEFDQSQQLYSIPSYWGLGKALNIARGLHVISACFIIAAYFMGDFHLIYLIGAMVFVGMLIYQHSIVKPNDLSKVNIAFMTANGIASIVFSIFVITGIILTF